MDSAHQRVGRAYYWWCESLPHRSRCHPSLVSGYTRSGDGSLLWIIQSTVTSANGRRERMRTLIMSIDLAGDGLALLLRKGCHGGPTLYRLVEYHISRSALEIVVCPSRYRGN